MTTNFSQNNAPRVANFNAARIANLNFNSLLDPAQRNVYDIANNGIAQRQDENTTHHEIEIDDEVVNLLNWLAQQEGISPEIALKKAVATAVYLRDLTANQGGRLLVERRDKSVAKIVLP